MKGLRTWLDDRTRERARRDLSRRLETIAAGPGPDLRDEIEEWAAAGRDRAALIGAGETLSFRDLYERSNRWARWSIVEGLVVGEPVILLFAIRPERTAAWLGLASVGAVATLLDPALGDRGLAAAIGAVRPRHVVVDAALLPLFEAAARHLGHACTVWVHGDHPMAYRRIDEALAGFAAVRLTGRDRRDLPRSGAAIAVVARAPDGRTRVAHLDHSRTALLARALAPLLETRRDDRLDAVEARPRLETLLAPFVALAVGASCRPLDAAVATPEGDADATILHHDAAEPVAPPSRSLRLIVAVDDGSPLPNRPATEAPATPERRAWSLRRDGETVFLRWDGEELVLPASPGEMRS